MAKIILKKNKKEEHVDDGDQIIDACRKLGVDIGCSDGLCGRCMINIEKGGENLSELTQAEEDLGLDKDLRLGCQCKIKKGEDVIDY